MNQLLDNPKAMKVAVIGSNGFVGQYILSELKKRGVDISVLNRRPSREPVCKELIADIHAPPENVYEKLGFPDVAIHLAWDELNAYYSPKHIQVELKAHQKFLTGLVRDGLKYLTVTGTCFEYGMQTGSLPETTRTEPVTEYGKAKNILRERLESLKDQSDFALTWARVFYVYGQGQWRTSLWGQLVQTADSGEKVFNMSGGEQIRDFVHIEEAANLLVDLALNLKDNGCVNVCSGKPISVKDLVCSWMSSNNWDLKLNLGHFPYPEYESMEFWGDRSKLDAILKRDKK